MISKNIFCKAINAIIDVDRKLDKLQNVNSGLTLAIVEEYSIQDELISVLEDAMDLYVDPKFGSTISWWIYETNFGKDEPIIRVGKGHNSIEYNLDTVEKLYDFCRLESKANKV